MKKKGVAYGLFEGRMYPFCRCSLINSCSAFCSDWVREYIFPGSVLGASFFNSMAWSHGRDSGKRCALCSLKTWACLWYSFGSWGVVLLWFCSASWEALVCVATHNFILRPHVFTALVNWAHRALVVLITTGSCA